MNRLFKLAFTGLILALVLKVLRDLDANKVVFSHQPGPCQIIPGIDKGSEDIALLSNGIAIISSGAYIPLAKANEPGGLFVYDLSAVPHTDTNSSHEQSHSRRPIGLTKLRIMDHPDLETFYPLGISAWETDHPLSPLLFVINGFKRCVEVYQLDLAAGIAKYDRTIRDSAFRVINNLIAVGPNQFYTTNFLYYDHYIMNAVEMFLKLPFGSVVYYDGESAHELISGLQGPNGIGLSRGKKQLYVSMNQGETLNTYFVKFPESGSNTGGNAELDVPTLELDSGIDLLTGPDNLFVDPEDGAVWIGAHPVAFQIITHLMDSLQYAAPSQVIKVNVGTETVTEVYGDDGSRLQGASVAVKYGDKLLIGTIRHKLMLCTLKHH